MISAFMMLAWFLFPTCSQDRGRDADDALELGLVLEPHIFEAYNGTRVDAELGKFWVTENRAADSSKRIQLAFVRFKSTNPRPGPPIVYLAGGPGGSGIQTAKSSRFPLFMAIREVADVIAFDQRATGMSSPFKFEECERTRKRPAGRPLDHDSLIALELEVAGECAAYWRKHGIDLAAYNTRESAADLEDLRMALGVEKISLWSISYGSHLALAALRYYPHSIERVILAGVEGPDHTVKLPSHSERQFAQLESLIQDDPVAKQDHPNFRETVVQILDLLEKNPVTIEFQPPGGEPVTRVIVGRPELERISITMLRDPSTMLALPAFYDRLAGGDFSGLGSSSVIRFEMEAMAEAMDAASGASDARIRLIHEEASEALFGGGAILANAGMAEALDIPDLGPEFRAPLSSSTPALFISGTLDGRTPVRNAEEVLTGFPNGVHLVIENAGHSNALFLSSPLILEKMLAFMKGESLSTEPIEAPPPDFSKVRQITTLPPAAGRSYLGDYQHPSGEVWRVISLGVYRTLDGKGKITAEDMRIQIRYGGNGYTLTPVSDTTFFIGLPGWEQTDYTFVLDDQARVRRMQYQDRTGSLVHLVKLKENASGR